MPIDPQKAANDFSSTLNDMNDTTRSSLQALMESATAVSSTSKELWEAFSSLMQGQMAQYTQSTQAILTAKNFQDLAETQAKCLREGVDSTVASLSQISQISARLAQQASGPVADHVNATMNKFSKTHAA